YAKRSSEFGFGQPSDERQVELAENMAQYWAYAKWHVNGLIENPGNDLMSEFIKELRKPENEDLWSLDYLYTVMHQFLFAGHEMRIALEELSRRLPHMNLVPGQPWEYSPNVCHRGPEHVLVTWDAGANP